jgi:hypothetical protein
VGFGRRKPPVARLRQRRRGRHGQEHHRYLRGQFEAAFDVAQQVVRNDPAFIAEWTLPKLIEAAQNLPDPLATLKVPATSGILNQDLLATAGMDRLDD